MKIERFQRACLKLVNTLCYIQNSNRSSCAVANMKLRPNRSTTNHLAIVVKDYHFNNQLYQQVLYQVIVNPTLRSNRFTLLSICTKVFTRVTWVIHLQLTPTFQISFKVYHSKNQPNQQWIPISSVSLLIITFFAVTLLT